MNLPKNVLWFQTLLYASLMLDALSVAFQDRTPSAEMTDGMIMIATSRCGARAMATAAAWIAESFMRTSMLQPRPN